MYTINVINFKFPKFREIKIVKASMVIVTIPSSVHIKPINNAPETMVEYGAYMNLHKFGYNGVFSFGGMDYL